MNISLMAFFPQEIGARLLIYYCFRRVLHEGSGRRITKSALKS